MDYLELGLVPYAFEPEYSESEIPDLPNLDSEFSDNSNTTSDNEHYSDNDSTDDGSSFSCDVNTSRPELCICGRCPDYSTLPLNERLCCCSTEYLSNKSPINNTCVTQHPDFNVICMHRGVLETAYARNQLDRKRTYNLGARCTVLLLTDRLLLGDTPGSGSVKVLGKSYQRVWCIQ
ncbi:uncharacterized protein LOC100378225 isoform X2 [Saccoglossus kowalevskii]